MHIAAGCSHFTQHQQRNCVTCSLFLRRSALPSVHLWASSKELPELGALSSGAGHAVPPVPGHMLRIAFTELANLHCHRRCGDRLEACRWCIAHGGAELARAPCSMLRPASAPVLCPFAGARLGRMRALQMQEARLSVQGSVGASTLVKGRPLAQQRTLAWLRRLQRSLRGRRASRQAVSL